MHRNLRVAFALLTLTVLTACGKDSPLSSGAVCPGSAIRQGISVDIEPAFAAKVRAAEMTVCWGGSCRTPKVELYESTAPNSTTTCTGTGPDAACGVGASRTGGKHGFADFTDLPATPVTVTLKLTSSSGGSAASRTLDVTPRISYPAGPECGGGTPQTGLKVSADGTITERA